MHKCIMNTEGIPESVIQMQKYFPKGSPKRRGRLVFANMLLVYSKEIEEIISGIKHSLERHKIRIGV